MITSTPKGNRPHISIFGRRNVGKSSFLNAFLNQELSIVSSTPGTTTDPVEKAYELHPAGPVLLIDTAGIDDEGELGNKRIQKTRDVLKRTDFAFLVVERKSLGDFERKIIELFRKKGLPWAIVVNKADLDDKTAHDEFISKLKGQFTVPVFGCSSLTKEGIEMIRLEVISGLNKLEPPPPIIKDLVASPDHVVLVTPIDKEAPKGRLILPQVQTIRELLDVDVPCVVLQETKLRYYLDNIARTKPKLVVTDSQAFKEVNAAVPEDILLTSFSILFARQKGDLKKYVEGVEMFDRLRDGDTVLIAELCSHHPIGEDIGRVKIPRWIKQYRGADVSFDVVAGKDFPKDLSKYKLIIQCGGCVVNHQLILSRIREAQAQGVATTNYGVAIAFLHGILKRALKVFPDSYHAFLEQ